MFYGKLVILYLHHNYALSIETGFL